MMNILTRIIIFSALIFCVMLPSAAYANDSALFSACNTNAQTQASPVCQDKGTTTNPVNHIIKVAADIIAILTGVSAVIFIILGGLTMVTSSGNTEAVGNARKRITYAVVGLVVVSLAWTIITFVTDKLITT
jgi:hypothetical protein